MARLSSLMRWALVLAPAVLISLIPVPLGLKPEAWRLLAVFVSTIMALIVQPIPIGASVLLGVFATVFTGATSLNKALSGFGNETVWMVLAAFFMVRAMVKTGLGRRIALLFIRAIGKNALGLGYSLLFTDVILGGIVPSTSARLGGILFPIASSLATTYRSYPDESRKKIGAFLLKLLYQGDMIVLGMFITGQASSLLIAGFAAKATGIQLTYSTWLLYSIVPAMICLIAMPLILYRIYPPEIKETPEARTYAETELTKLGKASSQEWVLGLVFIGLALLWMGGKSLDAMLGLEKLWGNATNVAFLGIAILLITHVLEWEDLLAEKSAWDVFVWYGGLMSLATALGESGLMEAFAAQVGGWMQGLSWQLALAALLLIYFYAHYGFASVTVHATVMYTPFVLVAIGLGAPVWWTVLLFAYFSNLCAGLTHYGTSSSPIYFGAGYITQREWWRLGFIFSVFNILVWSLFGSLWWKILGL